MRTGPPSPRSSACNTKAVVGTLTPVAAARKSARCLSRSMGTTPTAPRQTSGTEPLAPVRPALGNDLAAAHGRHAGAKTVTALAHQLARLEGPLHGLFSAGRPKSAVASFAWRWDFDLFPIPRNTGVAASKISRLIGDAARARQCDGQGHATTGAVAQARDEASKDGETALSGPMVG